MPNKDQPHDTGRDGFALVAALWLAGLFAAIAAGFAVSVRLNLLTHAAALHGLELEAAADGLTQLTAFRLAAEPTSPQPAPGTAYACRWSEGISAEVLIQDHSGLIDLNAADVRLIRRLAEGVSASPAQAEAIATAIDEFNNAVEGAEAGAPYGAIEELDQVPGMTEPLYRALLPHVTVYSLQAGFDPAVMTPELKRLLGFSPSGAPPPDLATLVAPSQKRFYRIDARVAAKGGARYRRIAIVDLPLGGNTGQPYAFAAWQRGGDFTMGPAAATPCFEEGPSN